ncbi:MAG: hypothetical protein IPJ77_03405 [Planctomycetes bacterium]|nr:hypothetical protein [Planctomycetota bacterium]
MARAVRGARIRRARERARVPAPEAALAAVERSYPLTLAAARAALVRADLALEAGRPEAARAWLERAREHEPSTVPEIGARFELALAARAALLPAPPRGIALATAPTRLVPQESRSHEDDDGLRPAEATRVLFGAAELAADALAVQSSRALHVRAPDGAWRSVAFEPLLAAADAPVPPAFADRASDWLLRPAAAGDVVACVVGRASDEFDNALVAFDARTLAPRFVLHGARELAAWSGGALAPGRVEFEPGPVAAGGALVVQVRAWPTSPAAPDGAETTPASPRPARLAPGRIEALLVALDPASGRPLWTRLVARGGSRVSLQERENIGITILAPPAAPLGSGGPAVTALTGLGTATVVDALDGRLAWTVRTARSRSGEHVPSALLAPRLNEPAAGDPLWTLSSDDGPGLYRLCAAPLARPTGAAEFLVRPPEPRRTVLTLALSEGGEVGLLPGARGWSEHRSEAPTATSFDPGPREHVLPAGLVLADRVVAVTDRALYLLDRTRGLAVLDRAPLAPGEAGTVALAHGRLWLLGPARIRSFRLE